MGNKHKRLEEQDTFKVVLKYIESDEIFNVFYNELTGKNSNNRDKKNYVKSFQIQYKLLYVPLNT